MQRPMSLTIRVMLATGGMFLMALSSPAEDATTRSAATRPAQFTVATYNINFGNVNLKEVVAAINASKANLVCLQETNPQSEQHLRRELLPKYPHMSFRHAPGAGGLGFMSDSPLRDVAYLAPRFGWFGALIVKVNLGGAEAQVAGVHLVPTDVRRARNAAEALRLFRETEAVRVAEIRHVRANLKKGTPTIVLGDFNAFSSMDSVRYLAGEGFTDSFASLRKDADEHPTWHWVHAGIEWKYRIDYIFHDAGIRTLRSEVVPTDGSDHYLLVSRLEWAPQEGRPGDKPARAIRDQPRAPPTRPARAADPR